MKKLILAAIFAPTITNAQALEESSIKLLAKTIELTKLDQDLDHAFGDMSCRFIHKLFNPNEIDTKVMLATAAYIHGRGVGVGQTEGPVMMVYSVCDKFPEMDIDDVMGLLEKDADGAKD